jgi:hypothetical protein
MDDPERVSQEESRPRGAVLDHRRKILRSVGELQNLKAGNLFGKFDHPLWRTAAARSVNQRNSRTTH